MSVRVGERGESKLEVQLLCERLIEHTVTILNNPKVFRPQYDKLHERILDTLISAGACMWEANGIKVDKDPQKYLKRRALQEEAITKLNLLLYLMTVSKRLDHLRARKYAHWSQLARKVRDMARKWRDSDHQRYGGLIREAG